MIKSLLSNNTVNSTKSIFEWIDSRNKEVRVNIDAIPFSKMEGWHTACDGSLRHKSGKFFSIEGINVKTDYGRTPEWDQPIINQPEIGYLGILTKEIDGVLHFLMQAKIEPGNINCVQISPTLQATKSNYRRVHEGRTPAYLEYFLNVKPQNVILDQLQSEQGARFLRKRNRNIIIRVEEEIPVLPDFRWMTLGQIKDMMRYDNMVNMDTRTVLSGINLTEYENPLTVYNGMSRLGLEMLKSAKTQCGWNSMGQILSWLSNLKAQYDLFIEKKPINELRGWHCTDSEIVNDAGKYFKVIGVNVSIDSREIRSWCQPLIQPMQQGLCAFIVKKIDGVYHFLMQAKMECGNYDVLELAPTVQSLTDNLYAYSSAGRAPFTDYILNAPADRILYDVMQSEEGGRFFHEQNRNIIVEADENFDLHLPPFYCWMTLGQIYNFLKFNNYVNIQARSLISAIK